ncbi:MAG TPA: hypothetical protein VGE07_26010, partial [Herpetosiphonaceae bacterium]
LRGWAGGANPLYADGLLLLAQRAKEDMDRGDVPNRDCGSPEYEEFPTEMYAELFAFMSLIDPDPAARENYAQRARTLLMHVMDIAVLGPSEEEMVCAETQSSGPLPFRGPRFFSEDSNRARWHGEAFPLVVDWIYPVLTAQDKQTIRTVFLRWSQEIIDRAYHHPEPVGMVNDPALINDRSQVRWSGNNYFTAHMRNLGLMALALDPADDAGGQLRAYLGNATGAWLYIFDNLTRTDSAGGLLPEGFEYSPQTASYALQFLLALHTAGAADCGQHCQIQGNPFWDDFVASYYHSLSPATIEDPDVGTVYQPAWYGDAQTYRSTDFISAFGALGAYDTLIGNQARLQSLRWAQIETPPGGAGSLQDRVRSPDDFRQSILYFMLLDPAAAPPADPRPAMPTEFFAPGINKLIARTGWDEGAGWFNVGLSWNLIDHQQADGNHFEWYRNGEWLTKARTGYANIAEGIASSEFRNLLALENDRPDRDDGDWRIDLWRRGSQWNLVPTGDPELLAHSSGPQFVYALGDATNLYNSANEGAEDIVHASRSIIWLKPDAVVVYDRGQSATANRFKRWWLQLPRPATVSGAQAAMTTAGGQRLSVTSLLPAGAALSAVNATEPEVEDTVAGNEPMTVRLRIDAPGNPSDVRFLTVLQASDGGAPPAATLIQSTDQAWAGAQVGTTVALFPATLGQPFATLSYAAPGATIHLIAGLQPNAGYTVTRSGANVTVQQGGPAMTDSGGVLVIQ